MKKAFSIIALILVILMVVSLLSGIVLSSSKANATGSVTGMQKELEELAKKKEQLTKELEVLSDKKDKELEKKSVIDEQINMTQEEISLLESIVSSLDEQLYNAEEELSKAEELLEENLELSKKRIRSAYQRGEASYLEIIAQSSTIYDLISRVEIAKKIAEKDREVIAAVTKSKEIIESKKAEIQTNLEENQKAANQLAQREKNLEKQQAESDKMIDEINSDAEATRRAVIAAEEAEEQLQAEIRAALAANNNSGGVVDTGDFRWPLDSKYNNITSKFGYRTHPVTGIYKLHSGVDIASSGIKGSSIYAAKGGTVIKAGYNTGYGNYVVINHGDGYATLYGHASSLTVSAGQTVNKGDVIGYVGSTGYSTGPHLHFEIMINGEYTNPLDYFSGVMTFTYY